jgi:hypothetical protein
MMGVHRGSFSGGHPMKKRVFWMCPDIDGACVDYEEQDIEVWLMGATRDATFRLCYGDPSHPDSAMVIAEITR